MFAYCLNNPVNLVDPSGTFSIKTLLSGVSLVGIGVIACAAAITVASGGACTPVLIAACITFGAGGITVLNGTAEIGESITDYNYMRDGIYGGDTQYYENQKDFFQVTAATGTVALGLYGKAPICFVAGTLILADEGFKTIESIQPGDYVWAWNEETGQVALKEVVETYVSEATELVHVFVDGEEIIATPSHPFYSPVKGWTSAVRLRAGDILQLVNGEYVVVEKVQHELLENPIKVYNFEVDDFHTYFVSESALLVHNRCEMHHILTNKHSYYTPLFKEIVSRFGLKLGGSWNIIPLENHHGRHTNAYHQYILKEITRMAEKASDKNAFLKSFEIIVDALNKDPRLPYM